MTDTTQPIKEPSREPSRVRQQQTIRERYGDDWFKELGRKSAAARRAKLGADFMRKATDARIAKQRQAREQQAGEARHD